MPWVKAIRAKYDFESWLHVRKYKHRNCSTFWKLLCKVGASIIPHIRVLINDGNSTNFYNDCWIPGSVISRSAYMLPTNLESDRLRLDVLIEGGNWNYHMINGIMGDGFTGLLNSIAIDSSLEEDSYVWGKECRTKPFNPLNRVFKDHPRGLSASALSCLSTRKMGWEGTSISHN